MLRVVVFLFTIFSSIVPLFGEAKIYPKPESVTFVTEEFIDDENLSIIQSGVDYYINVPFSKSKETEKKLKAIKGYVCYYNLETKSILSLMQESFPPKMIGDIKVYTGYTNSCQLYRYVNGKKVNIQIAFTEDEIIVGYPLILTGF